MSQRRYRVGENVFYPSAGVGVIEATEDLYLTGKRESCYVIRFPDAKLTIKVPCQKMVETGVRPLTEAKTVRALYKVLSGRAKRPKGSNPIDRARELNSKVTTGSLVDLAEVVRDLAHLKKAANGLTFDETRVLQTASQYLSQEIACVEGITQKAAIDKIYRHVAVG